MPAVLASTKNTKKIKLSVSVSGIQMSELEAQKFASSVQSNLSYTLGVASEDLEVEVSVDAGAVEEDVAEEDMPEMSAEEMAAMDPAEFKKSKKALASQMAGK